MVCARCGTSFEGRFCPNCGTPAPATPPLAPAAPPSVTFRCGRCGTLYSGRFCPTCGLPAWSPWIPPVVQRTPVGYVLLNLAWIFSLIAFLLVLGIATVGMFAMVPSIADGAADIRQGATVDSGFGSFGAWSFSPWSPDATGTVQPSGGNPGGYAEIQLAGRSGIVGGYWSQAFVTSGSHPFLAALRLDYRIFQTSTMLANLTIAVFVDSSSGSPPATLQGNVWSVTLAQTTNWIPTRAVYAPTGETLDLIDVSAKVSEARTYYVKVVARAWNTPGAPGTPTIVGFDNVRLSWRTNAFVEVFVVLPVPILFYYTQSPAVFYVLTATLVFVLMACLAFLAARDGRPLWRSMRMGSEQMPAKLRSRSATVAIMQTFLAVTFLSEVSAIIAALFSALPPTTFTQEVPLWYLLYALVNAPVYEEVVYRALAIGLPLMAGSLFFRARNVLRGGTPGGLTKGRYLAGSLRYLIGGGMSRNTSRAVLLPAFLFLIASSIAFGVAHAPGYGAWKVLPAFVAAAAMGYLFLRHGLYAAIIFHFATDVFVATALFLGDNSALGFALILGLIFLMVPGAGFFAYYIIYTARLARDVLRPKRPARMPATGPPAAGVPYGAGVPPSPYSPGAYPPGTPSAPAPPGPFSVPTGYVPATRPPGYGTSPVDYRCPRCAWVEAAYENGRFRCLRCGYVA